MLTFLKGFKSVVSKQVQSLILLAIGLLVLVQALDGNSDFLPFLRALLPVVLILGSVFLLTNLGQFFAAHLVMFVFMFDDGVRTFFNAITSYSFFAERFTADFDVYLFLTAIASIYLLMIIISYALSNEITFNLNIKPIAFPLFVFTIWCYLCYGFTTTLMLVMLTILAISSGSILASLMIMLSTVIIWPLIIITRIVDKTTEFTDITFWLVALSSVYVIYVLINHFFRHKDILLTKKA